MYLKKNHNQIIDPSFLSKKQEDEFINSFFDFGDDTTEENEIISPSSLSSGDEIIYDDVIEIETGQILTPTYFGLDEMQEMLRKAMNEKKWSGGDNSELNEIIANYCDICVSGKPRNTRECFEYFLRVIQNKKGLGNFKAEETTKVKFKSYFQRIKLRDGFFKAMVEPFNFLLKQLNFEEMIWLFQQSASKRTRRSECITELKSEFLDKLRECTAEQAKVIQDSFALFYDRNKPIYDFKQDVNAATSLIINKATKNELIILEQRNSLCFNSLLNTNAKNSFFSDKAFLLPAKLTTTEEVGLTLVEMQQMLQKAMREQQKIKSNIDEIIINYCHLYENGAQRNTRKCFEYFLQIIQNNQGLAIYPIKTETKEKFKKLFKKTMVPGPFFHELSKPFVPLMEKLTIGEMGWIFQKSGASTCRRHECMYEIQKVFLENLGKCSATQCVEIQNSLTDLYVKNKQILSFKQAVDKVVSSIIADNEKQLPVVNQLVEQSASIDGFFQRRIQVLSDFKENKINGTFSLPPEPKKVKYSEEVVESFVNKDIAYLPKSPKNG